jgi:hypothetical protein
LFGILILIWEWFWFLSLNLIPNFNSSKFMVACVFNFSLLRFNLLGHRKAKVWRIKPIFSFFPIAMNPKSLSN